MLVCQTPNCAPTRWHSGFSFVAPEGNFHFSTVCFVFVFIKLRIYIIFPQILITSQMLTPLYKNAVWYICPHAVTSTINLNYIRPKVRWYVVGLPPVCRWFHLFFNGWWQQSVEWLVLVFHCFCCLVWIWLGLMQPADWIQFSFLTHLINLCKLTDELICFK